MGVEIEDASLVAGLIGTKVFADELISFTDLNVLVCNRQIKVYYIHTAAIIHVFWILLRCMSVTRRVTDWGD